MDEGDNLDPAQRAKRDEYLRIVQEYKDFDMDGYRKELLGNFTAETDKINLEQDAHKSSLNKRLDELDRLHGEHKGLQKDNERTNKQRREILSKVEEQNTNFDKYAQESIAEKKKLRDQVADLEDTLRKLKDQLSEVQLDNKNLQLIVDTEGALREAKAQAETSAVKTVNQDLRAQIQRLETEMNEERSMKDSSKRVLDDLEKKFEKASKHFEALLKEAEDGKKQVELDLKNLKNALATRKSENAGLSKSIADNEKEVNRLNSLIATLKNDMEDASRKHEKAIKDLEEQRESSEAEIARLKKELAEVEHEIQKLNILATKSQHEIEYLSSEKDKLDGQQYEKRLKEFQQSIDESESKYRFLKDELDKANESWTTRLQRSTQEAEAQIRRTENEEHVKRIEKLIFELNEKNKQIADLNKKRDDLQREASPEDSAVKDQKVARHKDDLEKVNAELLQAVEEKNRVYDELTKNSRDLLATNDKIQKNSQEIAKLQQELEILRKELEQKDKIIEDLRNELADKKQQIADLSQDLEDKLAQIAELERALQEREDEAGRLNSLITEKDSIIEDLEAQLRELEEARNREPTPEPPKEEAPVYKAQKGDLVDEMLAQYINVANCPVPIKRLGDGYYLFGTRKIYAKIMNGKLVIRVGGGYMVIEEFIATYAQQELTKMQQQEARAAALEDEGSPGKRANVMGQVVDHRGTNDRQVDGRQGEEQTLTERDEPR